MKQPFLFTYLGFTAGLFALLGPPVSAQPTSFSSFKPGTVWPANDGVYIDCHGGNIMYRAPGKIYYWYGEHRGTPQGISCYSSKDLYNWENDGVVLAKGTIPVLERPKVAYNAAMNKYVMWFHYENSNYSLAHLGVAESDSAGGPFTLQTHFRPNGHQSRDIGMFCDDNGKVYLIYAADSVNVTVRIVELTADYLNVTPNDSDTHAHCEGPAILKCRGTYYLVTSQCSGWTPNQATYYTATNIMGPWTKRGDPCIGDTNHTTFNSQPCFIFQVPGYSNAFMYMGDRWNGVGSANSQYVFLPITITAAGAMELRWFAEWNLGMFTPLAINRHGLAERGMGFFRSRETATGRPAIFDIRGRNMIRAANGSFPESPGIYISAPQKTLPSVKLSK